MENSEKTADDSSPERIFVLVMDDEPVVLDSLAKAVELLGYRPLTATRGEDAICRFEEAYRQGIRIKAAVLDLTIRNGMGGRDTLAALRQMDLDMKAVAASGYGDNLADFARYGFDATIEKPFRMQELAEVLNRILPNK